MQVCSDRATVGREFKAGLNWVQLSVSHAYTAWTNLTRTTFRFADFAEQKAFMNDQV